MVNHGPSRGCAVCRTRRVKCDMRQPTCGNCIKRKSICPGARNLTEPVFKNTFSRDDTCKKGDLTYQQKSQAIRCTTVEIDPSESSLSGIESHAESPTVIEVEDAKQSTLFDEFQRPDIDEIVINVEKWMTLGCVGLPRPDLGDYHHSDNEQLSLDQFIVSMHPSEVHLLCYPDLPESPLALTEFEYNSSYPFDRCERVEDTLLSPYTILGNGASDPFDAAAIKIGAMEHYFLLDWRYCYMFQIWPSLRNKQMKKLGEKSWEDHCQSHLDNSIYLHNIVATCSLRLRHRIENRSEKQRLFLQAQNFQCRSLELLREHSHKGLIDLKLIFGVCTAAVTCFSFCDLSSCVMHLLAIKQLLDNSTEYTSLPWDAAICILTWDLWSANMLLQNPVFSSKNWLDLVHKHAFSTSPDTKIDKKLQQQLDEITTCLDSSLLDVSTSLQTETHLRNHRAIIQLANLADKTLLHDFHTAYRLYHVVQAYRGAIAIADLVLYNDISSSIQTESSSPLSNIGSTCDDHNNNNNDDYKTIYQKSLDLLKILSVSYCHKIIALQEPKGIMLYVPLHHLQHQILYLQQQQKDKTLTRSKRYPQINLMYACFIGSCVEQLVSEGYGNVLNSTLFTTTSWWHTREFLKLALKLRLEEFDTLVGLFRGLFLYAEEQMDVFLKTALNYKSYL